MLPTMWKCAKMKSVSKQGKTYNPIAILSYNSKN